MTGTDDVLAVADRLWTGDAGDRRIGHRPDGPRAGAWPRWPTAWPSCPRSPTSPPCHRRGPGARRRGQPVPVGRGPPHPAVLVRPPLHTAVYSHGHIDHVFGVHRWEADAEANGWPRPAGRGPRGGGRPVRPLHAHRRLQHGGQPPAVRPRRPRVADPVPLSGRDVPRPARPRRRRACGPSSTTPAARRTTTPGRGSRPARVLCTGDLFIWASPNAGNPQKVQRFPLEWAEALRRMLALYDARAPGPRCSCPATATRSWARTASGGR